MKYLSFVSKNISSDTLNDTIMILINLIMSSNSFYIKLKIDPL